MAKYLNKKNKIVVSEKLFFTKNAVGIGLTMETKRKTSSQSDFFFTILGKGPVPDQLGKIASFYQNWEFSVTTTLTKFEYLIIL